MYGWKSRICVSWKMASTGPNGLPRSLASRMARSSRSLGKKRTPANLFWPSGAAMPSPRRSIDRPTGPGGEAGGREGVAPLHVRRRGDARARGGAGELDAARRDHESSCRGEVAPSRRACVCSERKLCGRGGVFEREARFFFFSLSFFFFLMRWLELASCGRKRWRKDVIPFGP